MRRSPQFRDFDKGSNAENLNTKQGENLPLQPGKRQITLPSKPFPGPHGPT